MCKDRTILFSVVPSNRTRGKKAQTEIQKSPVQHNKNVLTTQVVKSWNKLPREVVEYTFLEILKTQQDLALSNWLYITLL